MDISYDILPEILLYSTFLGVTYFLLYYKYLYSFIDPLFIFIFNTIFSSVLVIEVV
jgi:hypothetical protein